MDTVKTFFTKSGHFFRFSKYGRGGLSPKDFQKKNSHKPNWNLCYRKEFMEMIALGEFLTLFLIGIILYI